MKPLPHYPQKWTDPVGFIIENLDQVIDLSDDELKTWVYDCLEKWDENIEEAERLQEIIGHRVDFTFLIAELKNNL